MPAKKLTPADLREHVKEFRKYGYDPYSSHFETINAGDSCVEVWWSVTEAVNRGDCPA